MLGKVINSYSIIRRYTEESKRLKHRSPNTTERKKSKGLGLQDGSKYKNHDTHESSREIHGARHARRRCVTSEKKIKALLERKK